MTSSPLLPLLAFLVLFSWMGFSPGAERRTLIRVKWSSSPSHQRNCTPGSRAQLTPGPDQAHTGWERNPERSDVTQLDSSRHRLSSECSKLSSTGVNKVRAASGLGTSPLTTATWLGRNSWGQEMGGIYPVQSAGLRLGSGNASGVDVTALDQTIRPKRRVVSERLKQIRASAPG